MSQYRLFSDLEGEGTPFRPSQFTPVSPSTMSQETVDPSVAMAVAQAMAGQGLAMRGYQQDPPAYLRGANPVYRQQRDYAKKKVSVMLPRRGPNGTLTKYGLSFRTASEMQRDQRLQDGYTGRGKYRGRSVLKRARRSIRGRGIYDGRGRVSFGRGFRRGLHKFRRGVDKVSHLASKYAPELGIATAAFAPEYALAVDSGLAANNMIRGRGSYLHANTNANSLFTGQSMGMLGGMTENQEMIISHTEYLQDVYGPATSQFNIESFKLNPALAENFPWLAQLAANYEEYEFIQLVFHFKSTVDPSATNNTNGATGTIIMATNYNADAGVFKTKEAMMGYHGAASGRLTNDMVHGVECDPQKNAGTGTKFVRSFPALGQSLKDFDLGTFQWAIVNCPNTFANSQIGELWCTYSVKLQKPKLVVALGRQLAFDRWFQGGPSTAIDSAAEIEPERIGYAGVQNSLNIQASFQKSAGAANGIREVQLVFPSFLTGCFECTILAYGLADNGNVPAGPGAPTACNWEQNTDVTLGNVVPFNCKLYYDGADKADWITNASTFGTDIPNGTMVKTFNVQVRPITDPQGGNNTVIMSWFCSTQNSQIPSWETFAVSVKPINDEVSFLFKDTADQKVLIG